MYDEITKEIFVGEVNFGESFTLSKRYIDTQGEQIKIYYIKMAPLAPETKKASLVICHGFGEHHEIYINFAIQFVLNGFEVHLFDFRGFG